MSYNYRLGSSEVTACMAAWNSSIGIGYKLCLQFSASCGVDISILTAGAMSAILLRALALCLLAQTVKSQGIVTCYKIYA